MIDLAIMGGTVVPMVENGTFFSGDVLVDNGRICEIRRHQATGVQARKTLDARGALVIPGLIQCHVHVVQSLLRHQADGLELLDWLQKRTWPYEAALDGDGIQGAAELGIAELLCGGTTTVLDFGTTHDHDRVFQVAETLGIRMISGQTHMDYGEDVPPALLEERDRSLSQAEALGRQWHGAANGRLGYAVTPRFALSCTRELLEDSVALARSNGWMLHTHASENIAEVEEARRRFGLSNIDYLDSVGLTGPDVILAHGVHLSNPEMERLATTQTRICHCPGANLKLASGIADVPAMLSRGIQVGLGADGAPCNNRLSIFHEMALAGTLHTLRHGPTALDAWSVLAMATREGARALHLSDRIGTLEPGKAADITIVGLEAWSLQPEGDPASRLVYGATAGDVRHVVVDGSPVVENGVILTGSGQDIREHAREAWHATRQRMED
ncbi:MAG: N-ethylammeline chlorohydrolase [Acidobacteria bacterium]|nr:MAG: N-ethylammeline chlorohydrolase [Acidobacteriota bacterium]